MKVRRESFFGGRVVEDPNEHFKVVISPDVAKAMLQKNSKNRSIRPRQVAAYARDMVDDYWNEDAPNSIIFDHDGSLVDGQHRLNAVVKSGVTLVMNVTVLVEGVQLSGIDRNVRRTMKDSFKMAYDIDMSTTLVSALKMWAGYTLSDFQPTTFNTMSYIISDAQHEKVYWDSNEQWDTVNAIARRGCNHPIAYRASAIVAAMAACKCGVSYNNLSDFFTIVNNGMPIENRDAQKSSAAFAARNYLLSVIENNDCRHKAPEVEGKLEEYIFLFVNGIQRKRPVIKATWRYCKQYGESVQQAIEA